MQTQALPNLLVDTEEGFVRVTLAIIGTKPVTDGVRFIAAALHEGERVGLAVTVEASGPGRADATPHSARVTLFSVGAESDRLLATLAGLYGVARHPGRMTDRLALAGLSLEGAPARVADERVKVRIFFEPDPSATGADGMGYFEWYLNIDAPRRQLQLAEKDRSYRGPIVRALAGGA